MANIGDEVEELRAELHSTPDGGFDAGGVDAVSAALSLVPSQAFYRASLTLPGVTSDSLFKSSAHPAEPLLVYALLVLEYLELQV